MDWCNLYGPDVQPTEKEISKYVDNPLWEEFHTFLQQNYETLPLYSYSQCSGQPGWNVKYQKAGRALCTLYPMPGFFIALVVMGAREREELEFITPVLTAYVQDLIAESALLMGGRWLMIQVTSEAILEDVEKLIQVRRKIRKRG